MTQSSVVTGADDIASHPNGASKITMVTIVEWALAAVLAVVAVYGHALNARHAGGLWRDEANLVATAEAATWNEWSQLLAFETSGPLCTLLLRLLNLAGLEWSDAALRAMGLGVGLLLLVTMWLACVAIARTPPLVTMAFVATTPALIRFGDSVRGYGVGAIAAFGVILAFWLYVVRPGRARWMLALAASLVAVHTMYGNAAIVLAASLGATIAVSKVRERVAAIGAGAICAASLLLEWPIFRAVADFMPAYRMPTGAADFWAAFVAFLIDRGDTAMLFVPTVLLLLAAGFAIGGVAGKILPSDDRKLLRFLIVVAIVYPATYVAFVWRSQFLPYAWHMLLPICVTAVLADCLRGRLQSARDLAIGKLKSWQCNFSTVARIVALGTSAIVTLAAATTDGTWDRLRRPATNVDIIAAALSKQANPDDLIVVAAWWRTASFARYHDGATPWTSVPDLGDRAVHRPDRMMSLLRRLDAGPSLAGEPEEIALLRQRIRGTLHAGGRIWWVGDEFLPASLTPLPRPSDQPLPWVQHPYVLAWGAAAEQEVLDAGGKWREFRLPASTVPDSLEQSRLRVAATQPNP